MSSPEMIHSHIPMIVTAIPLIGVFAMLIMKESPITTNITAYIMAMGTILSASMIPHALRGETIGYVYNTGLVTNLVSFRADALSVLTAFISNLVWTAATFYSIEYMKGEANLKRYNAFSLLSLCGMLGVTLTNNFFSLYIFFETLAIASYVMVIHEQTEEAKAAGKVYIFVGVFGGLILLCSIIATYALTGTGDMGQIGYLGALNHPWTPWIFMGFMLGFGAKAGLIPMHIWLPVAHPVAPSPGSALLSGVMVKAGCYGIIRIFYTVVGRDFAVGQPYVFIVMGLAALNIFLGSAIAMRQTEIKKMLAYSSISQVGYIVMGAAVLAPFGLMGSALHIFHHALIKGTLFLAAGAFIHQTGLRNLKDLRGIGKRMPLTTLAFTLASLSMIGFPPFNGFVSKWYLALGSLLSGTGTGPYGTPQAYGQNLGLAIMCLFFVSSFMNLIYYGPIIYKAWFQPVPSIEDMPKIHPHGGHGFRKLVFFEDGSVQKDDPNLTMLLPLGALAAATLITGLVPHILGVGQIAHKVVEFYYGFPMVTGR